MIEINESVGGPNPLLQFVPSDDLAGMLKQDLKNLEGLLLELDPDPVLTQFSGASVQFEDTEAHQSLTRLNGMHGASPPGLRSLSPPGKSE
jgi:hypothetical protein